MKKSLLLIFLCSFFLCLQAQKDTANIANKSLQKNTLREGSNNNVSIFPVPVRENQFTIKSEKEISFVKITNIIGQNIIFRATYNNPQFITKILLDNSKRGMYLVTIVFIDDSRIVRKIMVDDSN
jgi:hypothetical protein